MLLWHPSVLGRCFPSFSTLGETYQQFSQMETVCIGANYCKISSGLSKEQIWFSKEQGLLPTMQGMVWPSCHCACLVELCS